MSGRDVLGHVPFQLGGPVVGAVVGRPDRPRVTPWLLGGLTAVLIVTTGASTGASVRPVRNFGLQVLAGTHEFLWVCLLSPITGAVVAGAPARHCTPSPWSSDLDGGTADAAGLELPALPPRDRDEEHRQLPELPHARPLGRVVAPRARPSSSRAHVLLLGTEAEEEDHDPSVGSDSP